MRVIVCGGRHFKDRDKVQYSLDYWLQRLGITVVIQGGQVTVDTSDRSIPWEQRDRWGADYLAKQWAESRRIPVIEEAVTDEQWKKQGPAAGPIRNRRMLAHKPEYVIAFEGGAGTANMLQQARERGIRCIEVA